MGKQKTSSAAKKRLKLLKSGKIKRAQQNRGHILTKKSPKRKRGLRKTAYVSKTQEKTMRALISA